HPLGAQEHLAPRQRPLLLAGVEEDEARVALGGGGEGVDHRRVARGREGLALEPGEGQGRRRLHAPPPARRRSTRRTRSATVRTSAASASSRATRKRFSRPTTRVRSCTESSWRSASRRCEGSTASRLPTSSARIRRTSASTSALI